METVGIDVVAAQVEAYNARDLERFLACYASDAVIEDGLGQVLMQGHEAMRALYGTLFAQSPDLRCGFSCECGRPGVSQHLAG